MPGRHASADRSRFRRDLTRLIVLFLMTVVVAIAVVISVRLLVGGPDEPNPTETTVSDPGSDSAGGPPADATTSVASSSNTTVPIATTTVPSVATTLVEPITTLRPVWEPEQLTVLVLNAAGIAGLAGRLTERLTELGYGALTPDDHSSRVETSVVWYVEGFDREAEVLAEEIPDANIELFPRQEPRAPLTVVLGASYRE